MLCLHHCFIIGFTFDLFVARIVIKHEFSCKHSPGPVGGAENRGRRHSYLLYWTFCFPFSEGGGNHFNRIPSLSIYIPLNDLRINIFIA